MKSFQFKHVTVRNTKCSPDRRDRSEENVESQVKLEAVDEERIADVPLHRQTLPGVEDVGVCGVPPPDGLHPAVQHLPGLRHQADPLAAHLTRGLHYPDTPRLTSHLRESKIKKKVVSSSPHLSPKLVYLLREIVILWDEVTFPPAHLCLESGVAGPQLVLPVQG